MNWVSKKYYLNYNWVYNVSDLSERVSGKILFKFNRINVCSLLVFYTEPITLRLYYLVILQGWHFWILFLVSFGNFDLTDYLRRRRLFFFSPSILLPHSPLNSDQMSGEESIMLGNPNSPTGSSAASFVRPFWPPLAFDFGVVHIWRPNMRISF